MNAKSTVLKKFGSCFLIKESICGWLLLRGAVIEVANENFHSQSFILLLQMLPHMYLFFRMLSRFPNGCRVCPKCFIREGCGQQS